MVLTVEQRAKLRQTFAQMKHELGALQQQLENAPERTSEYGYQPAKVEGYLVDEYILAFRLGNISDLAMHLQELFKLSKS